MFAFLAGKGTPRHVTFDLARPLGDDEAVRVQSELLAVSGVVVARVVAAAGVIHVGYRVGASTPQALAAVIAGFGLEVRSIVDERAPASVPRDACC
jgi:hypothetical protein